VQPQAGASDNSGVDSVQYFLDGKYVGESNTGSNYPLNLDTTRYSDGSHWLLAEAFDKSSTCNQCNSAASVPANVVFSNYGGATTPPDTTFPSVSITAPAAGANLSGSVTVSADASDNVAVGRVDFLVDGALTSSDTSSPYGFVWDTTKLGNGGHTITANAYDSSNNLSSASAAVNVSNGDITPPSAPTGLAAAASAYNNVNLTWGASTDNVGVTGYYITRNGTTIAKTSGTGTGYSDTSVTASTSYSYQVMAYDSAGNSSNLSNAASVTTPSAPDTVPPSIPANLAANSVSSSQINLSWSPSTDNIAVSSYDIYRNSSKVASVSGATTSFGDAALAASTNYSYYVIARDGAGNSSAASNIASAITQPKPSAATGSLSGTVFSSKGGPAAGAAVSLRYSGSSHTFSTNTLGGYFINLIPGGSYSVKYSKSGFVSQTRSVTITPAVTSTIDITLVSRK
jgi:chitodextrinase